MFSDLRIGHGYDVHKLAEGRKFILGGVEIPYTRGLLAHSDGDVLIHAVMDSILGAMAKGDIGKLFPDSDMAYKDADSMVLFDKVLDIMKKEDYSILNMDITVIAQKPKLAPYIEKIRQSIAERAEIQINQVNVKATTEEHLGFTGREEGISVHCVVLLYK